jgi:hypothetical protein
MLTPSESNLVSFLLQRSFASRALDVVKMKKFIPCEVENQFKTYKTRIVEHVYDPLRIREVHARFRTAGYEFSDDMQALAVTGDGEILLWGGLNSVFHLPKGEKINGVFDEQHLAFNDILDLTERFKIKNKKVEIDEFIAQLKSTYGEQ